MVDGKWVAGDIIEVIEKRNNMGYGQYVDFLEGVAPVAYGYKALGSTGTATVRLSQRFFEGPCFAFGSAGDGAGINGTKISDEFTEPSGPTKGYWTIRTRFDPPASTRNIRSIGIGASGGSWPLAAIGLSTPCVQENNEILEVFYRIVIDDVAVLNNTNTNSAGLAVLGVEFGLRDSNSTYDSEEWYPADLYYDWWKQPKSGISQHINTVYTLANADGTTTSDRMIDGIKHYVNSQALSSNVGRLFGITYTGNTEQRLTTGLPIKQAGDSAIQNTFGRRPGNAEPYLDVDNLALGSGVVTITDTPGWTPEDEFAEKYKIEVTTGGITGVAEYKFKKQKFLGTLNAQFWSYPLFLPTCNRYKATDVSYETVDGTTNVRHGQTRGVITYLNDERIGIFTEKYIYPEFITADYTGITIVDVNGAFENIDANSTIPLPVTGISQIKHLDDSTILIADAGTGLWKIERTSRGPVTAITRITASGSLDDTHCRGFTIKKSDSSWWALFDKELAKSTDQGANWTIYNEASDPQFKLTGFTGVADDSTRLLHITIDPAHADDRFFIAAADTAPSDTTGRGFWWSVAGSTSVSDEVRTNSNVIYGGASTQRLVGSKCVYAAQNGEWFFKSEVTAYRASVMTFGSLTLLASFGTSSAPYTSGQGFNIYTDAGGTEYIIGYILNEKLVGKLPSNHDVNTYDLMIQESVASTSGDPVGTYSTTYDGMLSYIGEGVFVHYKSSVSLYFKTYFNTATDQNESLHERWESYGWNGSAWEKDHAGSKLTHTGTETLISGLDIKFADGGGGSEFIQDEFYHTYVYDGILKDDATSFDFASDMILANSEEMTVFTPATVPAADVGAVVAELGYGLSAEVNASGGIWFEPGFCGQNSGTGGYKGLFEEKLTGNFEIRFRPLQSRVGALSDSIFKIGLIAYSDVLGTKIEYLVFDQFSDPSIVNSTVYVRDTSAIIDTETITDGLTSDVYKIKRVSGTLTYSRNDVVFYTSLVTNNSDLQLFTEQASGNNFGSFFDIEFDYTIDRRYVEIGDGVATGRQDENFRKIVTHPNVVFKVNEIFLDAAPAAINADGFTPPGAGEVTIMPYSGRLWFNAADAGKTITGKTTYVKRLNLA